MACLLQAPEDQCTNEYNHDQGDEGVAHRVGIDLEKMGAVGLLHDAVIGFDGLLLVLSVAHELDRSPPHGAHVVAVVDADAVNDDSFTQLVLAHRSD